MAYAAYSVYSVCSVYLVYLVCFVCLVYSICLGYRVIVRVGVISLGPHALTLSRLTGFSFP